MKTQLAILPKSRAWTVDFIRFRILESLLIGCFTSLTYCIKNLIKSQDKSWNGSEAFNCRYIIRLSYEVAIR